MANNVVVNPVPWISKTPTHHDTKFVAMATVTTYPVLTQLTYVAVPGRNRTLFCCVLPPCYCVQSAVAENFH